jgi:NADH-quinone oxidoreductase subunit L
MKLIWLIPLLPAAGAAINGLFGIRWFNRAVAGVLACLTMAAALGVSLAAFAGLVALPADERVYDVVLAPWIPAIPLQTVSGIGRFEVPWAFRLDPLSAVMLLVVTGVGLLIHVYATAYMKDEPRGGYARFFCYLNLFCFFMLVLVLGANFLVMFVGWEGVGLCSYLLIGFWYEKKSAADAGKKAFITNRIGDWGFVLGVFLIFFTFGTIDFRAVAHAAAAMPVETAGFGTISMICLLLFVGATGKSAQIPLYVWLPDAMEGPTPVSALIHAATMVTAGVYMVARNAVLFEHAPTVMLIVAIVGALTALTAATIGLVQNDIKRVLAYSTVSQLGYMFLAAGVGAFAAGVFHLVTHAFFKALLFLGSGSVIHAMAGEQDMQRMGGLKKYMPVTCVTMTIGTLAIAGIPPLAGFFSKDEILYRAFLGNRVLWALGIVTALLTAFYMARLMALTFFGSYRGPAWSRTASHAAAAEAAAHGVTHPRDAHAHGQAQRDDHEVTHGAADVLQAHAWHGPHESPGTMTMPLMALAVGAIVVGFIGIPAVLGGADTIGTFLEPSFAVAAEEPGLRGPAYARGAAEEPGVRRPAYVRGAAEEPGVRRPAYVRGADLSGPPSPEMHLSHGVEIGLMILSVLVAAGGILLARHMYVRRPEIAAGLAERWPGLHSLLFHKYYVDELYDATVIRGVLASARGLWKVDGTVVDGAVNGSGALTRLTSWISHMADKYIVDGGVNLVGWTAGEGSLFLRRLQTGLVQNYALLMVLGVFVFLTVYLFGSG